MDNGRARLWQSLATKLGGDIAWNLGSFGLLAACGVLVNLVIAYRHGSEALGVFNQVYAIYIGLSQIFTFGVHYSVLKHIAQHAGSRALRERILASAAAIGVVLGVLACAAALLLRGPAGRLLDSAGVAGAMSWIAPALLLFPLNKILLGAVNGLREMKFFAIIQAVRYVFILAWIAAIAWLADDARLNAAAFLGAEVLVTLLASGFLLLRGYAVIGRTSGEWIRIHLGFGGKALFSGLFVELNSRIDTLIVGVFLSDSTVGIYSFATMFVDGFMQMLVVLRNNFNPLLVRFLHDRDLQGLGALVRRTRRAVYPLALLVVLAIFAAYLVIVQVLMPGRGFERGITVLGILLAAAWMYSAFVPFDSMLMQGGFPGVQTMQHASLIASNVALNAFLVPALGLTGAALATGGSYAVGALALCVLVRRRLGFDLPGASAVPQATPR